jgi:hypothetical protein
LTSFALLRWWSAWRTSWSGKLIAIRRRRRIDEAR